MPIYTAACTVYNTITAPKNFQLGPPKSHQNNLRTHKCTKIAACSSRKKSKLRPPCSLNHAQNWIGEYFEWCMCLCHTDLVNTETINLMQHIYQCNTECSIKVFRVSQSHKKGAARGAAPCNACLIFWIIVSYSSIIRALLDAFNVWEFNIILKSKGGPGQR